MSQLVLAAQIGIAASLQPMLYCRWLANLPVTISNCPLPTYSPKILYSVPYCLFQGLLYEKKNFSFQLRPQST